MLSSLTLTGLRVVLLPGKARLLPALVDCVDEVLTKVCVQLLSALLVGALSLCDVLKLLADMTWRDE